MHSQIVPARQQISIEHIHTTLVNKTPLVTPTTGDAGLGLNFRSQPET